MMWYSVPSVVLLIVGLLLLLLTSIREVSSRSAGYHFDKSIDCCRGRSLTSADLGQIGDKMTIPDLGWTQDVKTQTGELGIYDDIHVLRG